MLKKLLLLSMLLCSPTVANELTIIVPSANDAHGFNAKVLSKYLQKHDPSITNVMIRSMPGAANVIAANYLYEVAPRDGWTIAAFSKRIPLTGAVGGPNIKFKSEEFTWLGSTADGRKDAILLLAHRKRNTPMLIGFDSATSMEPLPFLVAALNGAVKPVQGYRNPNDIKLAFQRKEVDGFLNSRVGLLTVNPDFLVNPDYEVVLQYGNGINRHPDYKDVPTMAELIKDEKLREVLKVSELQNILIRAYAAPPGIPEQRKAALRKVFWAAANDPEYQQEAAAMRIEVSPISAEEAERVIKQMVNAPRELLDQLK